MSKNNKDDFVEKIKNRAKHTLKIEEVYLNGKSYEETISYLKKQKYIKFMEIDKVLKNNFISDYPFGYIIKDLKNNIVGFIGTIFSRRVFDNKEYIYCNIHSWIVNESHRINSFLLLTPLLEKKITLTAFTPVNSLIGLLKKFHFEQIKIKYKIVCFFNFFIFQKKTYYTIEKHESIMREKLSKNELKIFENYYDLPYEKFLIIDQNDSSKYIFVIASKVKKKGINILNLFYVSDHFKFKQNWNKFKFNIKKEFKVNFCLQYFFNDLHCIFPDRVFLSKTKTKDALVKNILPNISLDILYSDLIE